MGKRKQRTQARDFKEPRQNVWKEPRTEGGAPAERSRGTNFDEIVKANDTFDAYYKAQKICPEGEWETMMESFRTPLPTTFRINGSGKYALDIRDMLKKKYFKEISDLDGVAGEDGETLTAPFSLPWYPEELAWQMRYSRTQLRRLPALAGVHEFLKRANEFGSITRQEAVSMVPPFFLDVQPHHRVLDMCAAPGSKTFQLLEALHAKDGDAPGTLPTGLVVANDADLQRCNLLTHQIKRANSPALIVTNHEAQRFPFIKGPPGSGDEDGYRFDRILCDVPCTGDGTLRKAPDMWRRWAPGMGLGLHGLQVRIAMHGCRLLRVGGKLVYSTCSLNPIENEAVVAEILRQSAGAMVLEDVSSMHPQLKRLPGLKTWQVWDKSGPHASYGPEEERSKQIWPSMFATAESDAMPLERCMRVLPHLADTGAFFISVFTKVGELPRSANDQVPAASKPAAAAGAAAATEGAAAGAAAEGGEEGGVVDSGDAEDGADADAPAAAAAAPAAAGGDDWSRGGGGRSRLGTKGPNGKWNHLDPVVHVSDPNTQNSLIDFFGLAPGFPARTNLVTRTAEVAAPKRVYIVSEAVRQLLVADSRERLKITSTGLKIFEKQEARDNVESCTFRVAQEGVHVVMPHVTRQLARVSAMDFLRLLKHRSLMFAKADRAKDKPAFSVPEALKVGALRTGCVLVVPEFPPGEEFQSLADHPEELAIACWKGAISLGANINLNEGMHMMERLAAAFPEAAVAEADAKAAAAFAEAVESGLITGPPPREPKPEAAGAAGAAPAEAAAAEAVVKVVDVKTE